MAFQPPPVPGPIVGNAFPFVQVGPNLLEAHIDFAILGPRHIGYSFLLYFVNRFGGASNLSITVSSPYLVGVPQPPGTLGIVAPTRMFAAQLNTALPAGFIVPPAGQQHLPVNNGAIIRAAIAGQPLGAIPVGPGGSRNGQVVCEIRLLPPGFPIPPPPAPPAPPAPPTPPPVAQPPGQ